MKLRTLPKRVFDQTIRKRPCRPDLSVIEFLRNKDLGYLSNASMLETDLLPKLGLNNEMLHEMPEELYPFCGQVRIKCEYSEEYHFFEYVDQYESVRKRTGKSYRGIGVAVKESFMEHQI